MDEEPKLSQENHSNGASGVERHTRGELSAISNAIVRLYTEHYGRGPTHAETYWEDDLIICVLSDTLTTVERTLVDVDRTDHVRATRLLFQQAMEDRFKLAIGQITGRRVIASLSQTSVDPDVAVEVFVVAPETA